MVRANVYYVDIDKLRTIEEDIEAHSNPSEPVVKFDDYMQLDDRVRSLQAEIAALETVIDNLKFGLTVKPEFAVQSTEDNCLNPNMSCCDCEHCENAEDQTNDDVFPYGLVQYADSVCSGSNKDCDACQVCDDDFDWVD